MNITISQIIYLFFGFAVIGPVFLLPTLIAIRRNHPKSLYIALINSVFGWTGIGWAISILWAFSNKKI
tara:strand:+ start:1987 stop:2190 length:204 start_codon:yes stop_codon:yes gene_type:complete